MQSKINYVTLEVENISVIYHQLDGKGGYYLHIEDELCCGEFRDGEALRQIHPGLPGHRFRPAR